MPSATLAPTTSRIDTALTQTDASRFTIAVSDSFEAVRPVWDDLAREGHATPYQQYAFCEAFHRHVEAREGARPHLVVVRDGAGLPVLLLPLSVRATGPVRIARFIGGEHANFSMPVCSARAARLSAGDLMDILREAARPGIDLFAFRHQPQHWQGFANPLVQIGGQPSPSAGHKLTLQADAEALFRSIQSKDTRKKLRQKESKLAAMGTLAYRRASAADEARAILATFHALRAARFAAQGIANPFADEGIRAFLDEAATAKLASGQPSMELHALMLDERPIAIFGMVVHAGRMSGLLTAFDTDEALARHSPGDILLCRMIAEASARGLQTFDLGAGEAHYKDKVCKEIETLTDAVVPVSMTGWLAGLVMSLGIRAKRGLKQSSAGQKLIAALRHLKARKAS